MATVRRFTGDETGSGPAGVGVSSSIHVLMGKRKAPMPVGARTVCVFLRIFAWSVLKVQTESEAPKRNFSSEVFEGLSTFREYLGQVPDPRRMPPVIPLAEQSFLLCAESVVRHPTPADNADASHEAAWQLEGRCPGCGAKLLISTPKPELSRGETADRRS